MFSLQRLLAKNDKFYDLLEASAEQTFVSTRALADAMQKSVTAASLEVFVQARRQDKKIAEETSQQLCETFITPMEREDIESLSAALHKIPKTVEKFCEQLLLIPPDISLQTFTPQIRLLEKCAAILLEMVKGLRHDPKLDAIKDLNDKLHRLEGEADKLMLELLRDLYSGRHEAVRVLILRNLYELLEKIIDRYRDAGNVVFRIVLKSS